MGCINNIDYKNYPTQSEILGRAVNVCYHYDTNKQHKGVIIRDDIEEPGLTIIRLDNGRVLLDTECRYSLIELDYEDNSIDMGLN